MSRIIAAALLMIVFVANVVITHNVFTEPFPGHNDFMTPVEATHAFWVDGLNPYGEEATIRIQQRIFGRPALPEEDPGYYSYPFYATYITLPFVQMDYSWASAIWMVILEVSLVGALLLTLDLFRYRPSPIMITVYILWILIVYPGARGLILGQLSHFAVLLQILTLWALSRNRDSLAGIILAISTFKPQMGYLLVPFLLLWGLKERRWHFVGYFIGTFGALMASSFLFFPAWFGEWLHRLSLYPTYTRENTVQIITNSYLHLGKTGEWGLNILLYSLVFWSWWKVLIQKKQDWLMWTIMWTITITHLAAPRTATPHFVLFALILLFYFGILNKRRQYALLWLGIALTFALPWVHFLSTVGGVAGEQEAASVHVVMPLLMALLLWLTRYKWQQSSISINPKVEI